MLLAEPQFFARKFTEHDPSIRAEMLDHYLNGQYDPVGQPQLGKYYDYLAKRGRDGRRQQARFWQRSTVLDDSKEVLVIACKKWHIGAHFSETLRRVTGIDSIGYVFDQDQPLSMDLGNLEVGKEKRGRHRRAAEPRAERHVERRDANDAEPAPTVPQFHHSITRTLSSLYMLIIQFRLSSTR